MNSISDIAVLLRNGKSVRQSADAGGLPITRIETIADGTINPVKVGFAGLAESDCCDWLLRDGDILVSHINSTKHLGKCAIYEGSPPKLVHGMNLLVLRVAPDVAASQYVYRMLSSPDFRRQLPRITKDSVNQSSFNISNFKKLQIPLPPLEEQKRIAAILDAADDLRAKRRESLAQLDVLLQSTFLDMFGDPVTNPMGWNLEELGKICDVRDGTHDTPKYVQEGKPLLTSKNFKDGAIDIEGANLISDEDFHQINKRSKVDVGDLVMPMIGSIGNPVLVEREQEFAIKNVALFKFSAASPNNKFVRALLCSHYFNYVTSKANRGGTQKFVALKDLRGMPIPYPPIDLQRRFAAIVDSVEQQKAKQRAHLDELDTLFSSLQSRAFKGEL